MTDQENVVQLSRLQFGLTAMYHFLFVPLTLDLAVLLAIMRSIYITTGRTIWRDMLGFWGMLFGINFAIGVATGITMEFQFGTNWAYYAQYVGDVLEAPVVFRHLGQDVGRRSDAVEAQILAFARDHQRAPADQTRAQQWGQSLVVASPRGNAKRASAIVSVAKPPSRVYPLNNG